MVHFYNGLVVSNEISVFDGREKRGRGRNEIEGGVGEGVGIYELFCVVGGLNSSSGRCE